MSLQFGVNIPVQRRATPMSLFVLTIEQANRSVSLLGFDNQAASETSFTSKQYGYGTRLWLKHYSADT